MTNRTPDANGFVEIRRNPISRAGVFPYKGKSISPELDPEGIFWVYRPPEALNNPETIESFRLLPWTDDHPTNLLGNEGVGLVDPDTKGVRGVIGERVEFDPADETLYSNIKIFSPSLDDAIRLGKRELSAGMRCKYVPETGVAYGKAFQFVQTNIRGNHLSSVTEGRVGPDVAVLDSINFSFDAKEIDIMADTPETTSAAPGQMTLDQVVKMIEEIAPQLAIINEFMSARKPAEEIEKKEDEVVLDKDPNAPATVDKPAGTPPDAATDADADKDKTIAAMDARIKGLEAQVKANSPASLMTAMAERNRLAEKASQLVGAFDASEMSAQDVAMYALNKVGYKATPETAIASLQAYMHGRKPSTVTFALDAGDGQPKKSALDAHLQGA